MKRGVRIIGVGIVWGAVIGYLLFAGGVLREQGAQNLCHDLHVEVSDSAQYGFVTASLVRTWLTSSPHNPLNRPIDEIDLWALEKNLRERGYIANAQVYIARDGVLQVRLTQRHPMLRLMTRDGYNCYITEDLYVLPAQRYEVAYVPILSGVADLPFPKDFIGPLAQLPAATSKKTPQNYIFVTNLINFVKSLQQDDFWRSQILQIDLITTNVTEGNERSAQDSAPQIRLVPRMGEQVILLGTLENYEEKLAKLWTFYQRGMAYSDWEAYSLIDLRFDNQVICTRGAR